MLLFSIFLNKCVNQNVCVFQRNLIAVKTYMWLIQWKIFVVFTDLFSFSLDFPKSFFWIFCEHSAAFSNENGCDKCKYKNNVRNAPRFEFWTNKHRFGVSKSDDLLYFSLPSFSLCVAIFSINIGLKWHHWCRRKIIQTKQTYYNWWATKTIIFHLLTTTYKTEAAKKYFLRFFAISIVPRSNRMYNMNM